MKMHELLTDESKWTNNTSARNASRVAVNPDSPLAVCWCVSGAAERCYPDMKERVGIYHKIADHLGHAYERGPEDTLQDQMTAVLPGITFWNDRYSTSFEAVQTLLKELDI